MKIRYYTIRVGKKDADHTVLAIGGNVAYDYVAVLETRNYTEITFSCNRLEYIFERIGLLLNGIKVRRV